MLICTFVERGVRYSLFIVFYFLGYSAILYLPLSDFNAKISQESTSQSINLYRFNKYHMIYVFYLKKLSDFNQFAVGRFFSFVIGSHLFVNVSNTAGLAFHTY